MASLRILPWTGKEAADGTLPLYLVCRHKSRRATLMLEPRIHPRHWNNKRQEVRKSLSDYAKYNEYLAHVRSTGSGAAVRESESVGQDPWVRMPSRAALERRRTVREADFTPR